MRYNMLKSLFQKQSKQNNDGIVPIDPNNMPAHVAIIMDGNGRWAKRRGLPRTMGHRAGADVLKKIKKNQFYEITTHKFMVIARKNDMKQEN